MDNLGGMTGPGQASREAELRKRIADNASSDAGGGEGRDDTLATLHSGQSPEQELVLARDVAEGVPAGTANGLFDPDGPSGPLAEGTQDDGASGVSPLTRSPDSLGEKGDDDVPGSRKGAGTDAFHIEAPLIQPGREVSTGSSVDSTTENDRKTSSEPSGTFDTAEAAMPAGSVPGAFAIDAADILENAPGAVVGRLSTGGSEGEDAVTFTTLDERFEIVDGHLKLRPDMSLDHETADTITVNVIATVPTGLSTTESVEIHIRDMNEAPTSMTFTPDATGPAVLAILKVRLAGEAYQGNPRYEIVVDGKLVAKGEVDWSHSGGRLSREDVEWRDVTVELPRDADGFGRVEVRFPNDHYHGDSTRDRNLLIDRIELDGHVMEAEGPGVQYKGGKGVSTERMAWRGSQIFDTSGIEPPALPIVDENAPGAVIGRLDIADPDSGEIFTYTLSDDRFEIVDGVLKLADGVALDHEASSMLDIRVEARDTAGHMISRNIEVVVRDLDEAPRDLNLSNTSIGEAEQGAVLGRLSATDDDGGAMSWQVSDERFEVRDGEVRLKADMVLDHETEPGIDLEVTATDDSGLSTSRTIAVDVRDVVETDLAIDVTTGFRIDFFDYDTWVDATSDIDWTATPAHRAVARTVDFDVTRGSFWDGGTGDRFAVRVTGAIEVGEDGRYEFRTRSDDGSRVFIDGQEVVVNDGDHGMRTRTGSAELEPGFHSVEIQYFENDGVAGLTFEMRGPGESMFSLVEAPSDLSVSQGEALAVGIDIAGADDLHGTSLHGLPHGAVIMDEVNALISDGEPVDLSDWNLEGLEIVPPPDFSGTIDLTLRASGVEPNGAPFNSIRSMSIQVVPDPDGALPPAEPFGVDCAESASWVDDLNAPDPSTDPSEAAIVEHNAQGETGDDQMLAYDRMEL